MKQLGCYMRCIRSWGSLPLPRNLVQDPYQGEVNPPPKMRSDYLHGLAQPIFHFPGKQINTSSDFVGQVFYTTKQKANIKTNVKLTVLLGHNCHCSYTMLSLEKTKGTCNVQHSSNFSLLMQRILWSDHSN